MARTACAFVPRYELALRARSDPSLMRRPVAVVDLDGPGRIGAVSPVAEALGIAPGQLAVSARARCPELDVIAPDPALVAEGERDVLRALDRVSPCLDSDGRGAFFLGLGGLERITGSEAQLAARVREVVSGLGLPVCVAVADRPLSAWMAARRARPVKIVPPGGDGALFGAVPIGDLPLDEKAFELCALLGLDTTAAIAALPAGELARRLGAAGAELERMLDGARPLAWPREGVAPVDPERVELEVDPPMDDLEPLLFMAKSMIDRLLAALATSRRNLAELSIEVRLDDRSIVRHALVPAEPTLESRVLVDLFRLWLDQHPVRSPVAGILLVASGTALPTARQLSLYRQREEKEEAALAKAVARLEAAFGVGCAVRPSLGDTWRPEARVEWKEYGKPASGNRSLEQATGDRRQATGDRRWATGMIMRVRDPEEIEWPGGVVEMDGPHCVAGEWWDKGYDRRYFWLTLEDGSLVWVFRDGDGRTFLHGVAD